MSQAQPSLQQSATGAAASAYSADAHDALLAHWRAGVLGSGATLEQLQAWLAGTADGAARRRLASDAIVVAAQSGVEQQALALARTQPLEQFADYALVPLAGAARAAGNTALQADTVRLLLSRQPDGWDARVQEALLLLDQRNLDAAQSAIEALAARPQAGMPAQQVGVRELRGALAEARGDKAQALLHYQDVLVLRPDHRYAGRATVLLTAGLGAPNAALESAAARPGQFSALELSGLKQAALGERLRWGMGERDLLEPADPQRFFLLDAVIRDGGTLAAEFGAAQALAPPRDRDEWQALRRRLAADRVVAAFERGLYPRTVELYDALRAEFNEAPYYATAAAAGAHAQLRRPDIAVPLYEQALRDGGPAVRMPSDIHVGLVYAYLDTGRFREADTLLDGMIAGTPPLLNLSPERGRPNNDYGDLLGLRALVDLYTDRLDRAEGSFGRLTTLAPLNTARRVGQARTERARGHPQAALQSFEEITAMDARSIDARAGHAETLFDNGALNDARNRVDALAQQHPDHPSVRSAVRTRDTVMSPRLTVDAGTGRDGGTLSNRDWSAQARLDGPWDASQRRLFATAWTGGAEVGADRPRHGRAGLGLQWRQGVWDVEAQVHQSSSGPRRTGVAAAAGWRASDQWSLAAQLDTNGVDVPWRARQAGVSGRDLQAQARYQVHESRGFEGRVQHRAYSDGNKRQAVGASWQERWISGPRLQLQTTLGADTARNSDQSVPYFSPARESAVALTARTQVVGWRRDDRSMLHVLEAGVGRYSQSGFGSGPTSQLRYAHEWNWAAGYQLRYGLGTSTHPYDGVRERRREVFVHFTMPFQ